MTADKKKDNGETAKAGNIVPRFNKGQIAASARYCGQRDLVMALLDEKKTYTFEMVDGLIEKYKKGQVE